MGQAMEKEYLLRDEIVEFVESMASQVDYYEDPDECWEAMQELAIEHIEADNAGAYFDNAEDEDNEKVIKIIKSL